MEKQESIHGKNTSHSCSVETMKEYEVEMIPILFVHLSLQPSIIVCPLIRHVLERNLFTYTQQTPLPLCWDLLGAEHTH